MKTIQTWEVRAGNFSRHYFTAHHAEQTARALELNGMTVTITKGELPNDPLTRLLKTTGD